MSNVSNEKLSSLFGTGFTPDEREPEEEFEPDSTPIDEPKIDEIEAALMSHGMNLYKRASRHAAEEPSARGFEVAGKILSDLIASSSRIKSRMIEEKRAASVGQDGQEAGVVYKGSLSDLLSAFKSK
jgi:hypothetical protein